MLLLIILLLILVLVYNYSGTKEMYNNSVGQYCMSCDTKTLSQCMNCFNCGVCVDRAGNKTCVPGDIHGPFNNDDCVEYYNVDPYRTAMQHNNNYKCSYGPSNYSRTLSGIYNNL
jgi:hypothetical protein